MEFHILSQNFTILAVQNTIYGFVGSPYLLQGAASAEKCISHHCPALALASTPGL